jgi:hypothetical protein
MPRREAVTPMPSRRRTSWSVSPRAIGKWAVLLVEVSFAWYGNRIGWMGFRFVCAYGGHGHFWLRSECHIDGLVEC